MVSIPVIVKEIGCQQNEYTYSLVFFKKNSRGFYHCNEIFII